MSTNFVAFDLEVADELPDTEDWHRLLPLPISCVGIANRQTDTIVALHGQEADDGRLAHQLTPEQARSIVIYLENLARDGATLVSWNGLGFDLIVLAEACEGAYWTDRCRALALDHCDMAFQMLCERGFMISLQTAAEACGLPGKLEGVSGKDAPRLWAGSRAEQERVLDYVAQDARTTGGIYEHLLEEGHLVWTSKQGRKNVWLPVWGERLDRMLTVREALALPEPEVSWMEPWPRERFSGWLQRGDLHAAA